MSYFSKIIYIADGVNKTYSIPFSYLSTSFVEVFVDGVEKVLNVDFTFLNSYTIELVECPVAGILVTIQRSTKKDGRLVQFQNASLLDEVAQNKSAEQGLNVLQETLDATETAMIEDVMGNLDAKDRKIVNLATPVEPEDAVTKAYADTPITNAQVYVDEEIIPILDAYIGEGNSILDATEAAVLSVEQHAAEAEASADAASASESGALASEQKAEKWADEAEDVEVETNKYSAKHWAIKAGELALNEAQDTIAAHATACDIWSKPKNIELSGAVVTFTDLADAPQAGAVRWVKSNAAHVLTNNANLIVQSGANVTLASDDWIRVEAITTTTFSILVFRADGTALLKVSSNDAVGGHLNGKLVAGSGISLAENNNGGDETLTISASGGLKIGVMISGGFGYISQAANDIHASRYKAPISTRITRLGIQIASATNGQKLVLGIYADSSNAPGVKLGQTNEITLVVAGDNEQEHFLTLTSPVDLVAGTNYWLVNHSNVGIDVEKVCSRLNRNKYKTVAYSATLPNPFGTPTGVSAAVQVMGGY